MGLLEDSRCEHDTQCNCNQQLTRAYALAHCLLFVKCLLCQHCLIVLFGHRAAYQLFAFYAIETRTVQKHWELML
jgi:hypothetical protein